MKSFNSWTLAGLVVSTSGNSKRPSELIFHAYTGVIDQVDSKIISYIGFNENKILAYVEHQEKVDKEQLQLTLS